MKKKKDNVNNMSIIKLYRGDCLIEMNKIADKSVDLILELSKDRELI